MKCCRIRLIALSFLLPYMVLGQSQIEFGAEVNSTGVRVGEPFQISFVFKGGQAEQITPPDLKNFEVVSGPFHQSSTSIINGRMNTEMSESYTLLATNEGTFTIGPATAVYKGKKYYSRSLDITVEEAGEPEELQPGEGAVEDADLFVRASLSADTAFVGEQIYLVYEIFTRVNVQGADFVNFPKLDDFYQAGVGHYDRNRRQVEVGGRMYTTQIIRRLAVFPQRSGNLLIEPASLRAEITDRNAGNANRFFSFPRVKSKYLHTNRLELLVLPLPDERPESFFGAVGKHLFRLEANRSSLSVGEAIELKLKTIGLGDPRRLEQPPLLIDTAFEVFDALRSEEDFDLRNGTVVYRNEWTWVLVPRHQGSYSLSPPFTYFDTDSMDWVTVRPDTIEILVSGTAGTYTGRTGVAAESPGLKSEILPAEELKKGGGRFFGSATFWFLLFLPLAVSALIYIRKDQLKRRAASGDLRTPVEKAMDEIDRIPGANLDFKSKMQMLRNAFEQAVAALLNIDISHFTRERLNLAAVETGIDGDLADQIKELLDKMDVLLYAGREEGSHIPDLSERVKEVIRRLESQTSAS